MGIPALTLGSFSYYNYEFARDNPKELFNSSKRLAYLIKGGTLLASNYLFSKEALEKKHEQGADILYEILLNN